MCIPAVLFTACSPAATPTPAPTAVPTVAPAAADLSGVKTYMVEHATALAQSAVDLSAQANKYYDLAKSVNFDYAKLWQDKAADTKAAVEGTRALFIQANPQYEQMEGIVAGTPSLSQYDVILDAGSPGSAADDSVVPFDLTLADGRVLPKPGNLFEVLESTLWGTDPTYIAPGNVVADFNGNGQTDLGDTLPDANILKSAAESFVKYTADLKADGIAWQPTEAEAFGALVGNVPTVADFMEGWKNSRFVEGTQSTERGFVATSRLSDLRDNLQSWQTIYAGLSVHVQTVDPDQDKRIVEGLKTLHDYISGLYDQEKGGKHFTPEEADALTQQGQDQATTITGQLTQVAAKLNVPLEQ